MNTTDKQIMTALVYIKNNPDCTTRGTELDENIIHYLYENDLADGNNTLSGSSDKGAKYEYSFLTITTQGEKYLESQKQHSPLNIFNNKTIRFIITSLFLASLVVAGNLVTNYLQKTNQEQAQPSPSEATGENQ